VEGMSHKIDRSFKLIFWGAELGEFNVKGKIYDNKYEVSTEASGKSIIRFFSRFKISSGAIGNINDREELIPIQSMTKWNTRGKFRQTQLRYDDGKLIQFDASPELIKDFHIKNPIGSSNTIDPVSLVLELLIKRAENKICEKKLIILDGFRMSELSFETKSNFQDRIICSGKIKRSQGFKPSDLAKKPLKFKIVYSLINMNNFDLSRVEIETIFGKMVLKSF
tara:strand:+ start:445 stop:1113 length:669 start_codon:yes stop_codon:yes gene_type:complete